MFCSDCGSRLADTAKFCSGCGASQLESATSISVQSPGIPSYGTHMTQDQIKLNAGKNSAELVYLMYALSFLFIIPAFIGIFIAYGKVGDLKDTYLESHFRWQIQTFWLYFFCGVLLIAILFFPVAMSGESILSKLGLCIVLAIGSGIWLIYRIVKGWTTLSEFKQIQTS